MYDLILQLLFHSNGEICTSLKNQMRAFITASFQVRAYAVSVLERADDEELQCYLLQLVQALRFERSDKSRLSHFLVQRGRCTRV